MCLFLWIFSVFRERRITNSTYLFHLLWVFAFERVLYSKLRPTKKKGTEGIKCVYNIHRANLSCHSRAVNILHNSYNFYLHTRRRHRSFFFQYCVWLHSVNITENSRNLLCAVSVCFFFVIVISFNFELNGRKKNRL